MTTTPTVHTIPPQPERDRWGRPLVVPPEGGKPVPYTRCTTYVGCLEDMYKLGQWQQRHAVRGVALHDDLLAAVRDTDPERKADLNALVDEAKERSGAGDAARMGTYLHAVTEAADRGMDPGEVPRPWMSSGDLDPLAYVPDLAAYLEATDALKAVHIEQFTVHDPLKIGGTPDRVVTYQGKRYIADLKTGSIEYGTLKIAAQLAVYARSRPYDVTTHERLEPHRAEVDKGIVIHLPAGTGTCRLYWVDLLEGWEAVKVARDVRGRRSLGFRTLATPLDTTAPAPQPPVAPSDPLPGLIAAAADEQAVRDLWAAHAAAWQPQHTDLAKARIAALAK